MKRLYWTVTTIWLWTAACIAAEQLPLSEQRFQERMRGLAGERDAGSRLERAKELLAQQRLSSLQVKAIAARLGDDAARLEFATLAYPSTVDPENFYEVYDAFTTFSKVMRLHDRIRQAQLASEPPAPVLVTATAVTEEEMKSMLQALRKEPFEQTRNRVARQILESRGRHFLTAQVKQMLECFTFEATKLELAKYAYDYTVDRENYFTLNDAFSFSNSKESLAQYIEAHNQSSSKH